MTVSAISPTTSAAAQAAAATAQPGGTMGKDEFLQMLVAQLRHQDPLEPMNGDQMAAQLAQFSSVEELTKISEQLDKQNQMTELFAAAVNNSSTVNLIGRNVVVPGNDLTIGPSGDRAVSVDIGGSGGSGTLHVYGADGKEVASRALGDLSAGRQEIPLGDLVDSLDEGQYTYSIDVVGADEESVPVTAYMRVPVDAVRYTDDGLTLVSGTHTFPISSVLEIGAAPSPQR
jgi:flagellar basal-body rod modification protein FlgD